MLYLFLCIISFCCGIIFAQNRKLIKTYRDQLQTMLNKHFEYLDNQKQQYNIELANIQEDHKQKLSHIGLVFQQNILCIEQEAQQALNEYNDLLDKQRAKVIKKTQLIKYKG